MLFTEPAIGRRTRLEWLTGWSPNCPRHCSWTTAPHHFPGLEAELLRRFSEPAQLTAPEARTFYEGFSAYFGTVILRNGGGRRWGWATTWEDVDPPLVMPEEELDLEPLSPWEAALHAVERREGDVFYTIWESWDKAAMDRLVQSTSAAVLAAAQAKLQADAAEFSQWAESATAAEYASYASELAAEAATLAELPDATELAALAAELAARAALAVGPVELESDQDNDSR
ncbi:hypothetical protein [Nocardia sp. CDC160]|uniref:hypothetical protein n=1 Tax=Nocardia sp. CDC160 TaxID=3112166 RepID=UPI002DB67D2A|nr:hypothetical protein [Nocardia sp. CDC160]MEC3919213.1 hypothetical protein [Nocardia sp. CDC160]